MESLLINNNRVNLGPGEVIFKEAPGEIWMVLGSCLSIILYEPKSKFTAACHAQLPTNYKYKHECFSKCPVKCMKKGEDSNTYKFLSCCFNSMRLECKKRGIELKDMEAHIYGGSDVMRFTAHETIGQQNIKKVKELIENNNLNVKEIDIGGKKGRTILFDTATGKANIKIQQKSVLDTK